MDEEKPVIVIGRIYPNSWVTRKGVATKLFRLERIYANSEGQSAVPSKIQKTTSNISPRMDGKKKAGSRVQKDAHRS